MPPFLHSTRCPSNPRTLSRFVALTLPINLNFGGSLRSAKMGVMPRVKTRNILQKNDLSKAPCLKFT